MTNYYEILDINPELNTEAIQKKLLEKEQIWRNRESGRPELAGKKLASIEEAKKIFADDTLRKEYDRQLAGTAASAGDSSDAAPDIADERTELTGVTLYGLSAYFTERCELWDSINRCLNEVKEKYTGNNFENHGWILARTATHIRHTDEKDQDRYDDTDYVYVLTCRGQLLVLQTNHDIRVYLWNGCFQSSQEDNSRIISPDKEPRYADRILSEFDFQVSLSSPVEYSHLYTCTSAWAWQDMLSSEFSKPGSVSDIRWLPGKKGAGLLRTISDILRTGKKPEKLVELIQILEAEQKKKAQEKSPEDIARESEEYETLLKKNKLRELNQNTAPSHEFKLTSSYGYDMNEVDEYLEKTHDAIELYISEDRFPEEYSIRPLKDCPFSDCSYMSFDKEDVQSYLNGIYNMLKECVDPSVFTELEKVRGHMESFADNQTVLPTDDMTRLSEEERLLLIYREKHKLCIFCGSSEHKKGFLRNYDSCAKCKKPWKYY